MVAASSWLDVKQFLPVLQGCRLGLMCTILLYTALSFAPLHCTKLHLTALKGCIKVTVGQIWGDEW